MSQNTDVDSSQSASWVILYNLYFNNEMVASNLTLDEIAATRWHEVISAALQQGDELPLGILGESTGAWLEEVQDPKAYRMAKVNRDRRAMRRDMAQVHINEPTATLNDR